MVNLLFIRHGATAGNLEKRYIGRTDEPLCKEGIRQAEQLRKEGHTAEYLFVSPLLRTRQTAELVFPEQRYITVDAFAETDFGIFEGRTAIELAENPQYRRWVESQCLSPIPDGESIEDFKARCCHGFREAIANLPDGAAAAFVIHGGVIMAILEDFGPAGRSFYDYHIKNGEALACHWADGNIEL